MHCCLTLGPHTCVPSPDGTSLPFNPGCTCYILSWTQPDHSVKLQHFIYHHSGGVFVQSVLQLLCIVADKVDIQVAFFFWSKNKTYLMVIKISLCSFALIPTDDTREKWQFCFRKQTWLCEKRFALPNQRICVEER